MSGKDKSSSQEKKNVNIPEDDEKFIFDNLNDEEEENVSEERRYWQDYYADEEGHLRFREGKKLKKKGKQGDRESE